MTINVVQINSGDLIGRRFNGFDLHPYLQDLGVKSTQLVYWNKQSDADFVSKMFDYPGSRLLTRALTIVENRASLHARLHPHSWTLPSHKKVQEADIMHLHIIHDGYFSLSALPYVTSKKPTVWTWHDPWPMTGHCIYPLECTRWTTGCGFCPNLQLPFSMRTDRTAEQFAWKRRLYKKTKAEIVVASQWMMDMAANSPLAETFNFNLIPFGLDLDRYKPRDRRAARERLGIFPDRPVIFLRASSTPFKGLSEFVKALELLDPDLRLCIISLQETGQFDAFIGRHQIIEFGWTNDEELLLNAYAACDFFAMPSKAEAFGLMAIEAMACARPVLCFTGTSLPGVAFAPEAGWAVPENDIEALANAIDYLVRDRLACEQRGIASRALAEAHYDIRQQARLTADLYERVLERQNVENNVGRRAKALEAK
ncbi:glycosyltransferase family 4 protein [Rhizobium johnstonii]|uniref:glycosyltransferase family 4 protein n=1 Tax=Rhizobium TaxID=379 RepID=UPI00102F6174|nr:glycosyltransferase family 4 protein [Rhizobium leguminosarum]TBF97693.1 glycosyltransferase [Rhizobium leguminosarum]TBG51995.1 glycosyltransferase [Rhizobium leguminosarum]TBH10137.1 glycosyltransferase [Rhizobium leguminosarum]TBH57375.1 glycosyltransferase [Rhizobium leguminosarum]